MAEKKDAPARSVDSKSFKKVQFEFGNYKMRYAWVSQRGYYPEDLDKANQDQLVDVQAFGKDQGIEDTVFFGVFDGHGKTGDLCSIFTRDNVPGLLLKELVKGKGQDIELAHKTAFKEVNQMLHDRSDIDDTMSGTTAITCLFAKGTLYIANVGDSRCIAGQTNKAGKLVAVPLSEDQTPFRKDERDRCKSAGAVVANMDQMDGLEPMHENWTEGGQAGDDEEDDSGDPPRIWLKSKMLPGCAFTRSIGDSIGESVGVFAEPETMVVELTEDHKYVILASDGVWEFITNQTCLNMVAAYKSPLKACKAVVNEAYKLWLQYDVRTDDITMIAIYLEDMGQLAEAHEAQRAALAESLANQTESGKKAAAQREMRRRSSVSGLNKLNPGKPGPLNALQGVENRTVRRVMTKEKKRAVITDNTAEVDWQNRKEKEFTYKVKETKLSGDDVAEITKAVQTNFLLSHLNEQQQKDVFGSMEECICKDGDTIITAGQPGEWFYVVKSGVYDAFIDGAWIHQYKMDSEEAEGKQGLSFGELALLYVQQPRAATIKCIGDGTLWRLHAKTFRTVVMRSSTQQLLKTLRSVEVLRELTLAQLQSLYDALSEVNVSAGTYIIKEGDPGRDFFVVMDGEAKVLKLDPTTKSDQEVMSLKTHDYFGERALLNDAPRAASVKASTDMKLLQISKEHFEEVLGSLDEIIDKHRRKREEISRRTYLQRQAEGLLDASAHDFQAVMKIASWKASDLYVAKRKEKLAEDDGNKQKEHEGQRLLIRVVSKKMATEFEMRTRVMSEIKLMGDMISSNYVPALLATFSDRSRMFAVMGCVAVTDLFKAIDDRALIDVPDLGESAARFFTAAMMLAMIHLHRQEIIYRMCTVDSVVLDGQGYPLMLDFTLAKKLTDCGGRTYTLCGVPEYNAPEQVTKAGHGKEPDWWAIGIFTYEMLFNKTPFAQNEPETEPALAAKAGERRPSLARVMVNAPTEQQAQMRTYKAIANYAGMPEPRTLPYPDSGKQPSAEAKSMIEQLLEPTPEYRFGSSPQVMEDIVLHPWFTDFNFVALEDKSLPSPFAKKCQEDLNAIINETKGTSFEAPGYVGDNRWCDDWDYTCTVGASVENTTEKPAMPLLSSVKKDTTFTNLKRRNSQPGVPSRFQLQTTSPIIEE